MKRDTKKTPHPGIRRDGTKFTIRVAMRDPMTRRHREKERLIEGTIHDAIKARQELRDNLSREMEAEQLGSIAVERPPTNETVIEFSKRWLAHLHKTGRNRPHVLAHHVNILANFVLPSLGAMNVHEIQRGDVARWMAQLGELRHGDGKPYARDTLLSVWGTLRTMLRDALVLADLDKDPTDGVRFTAKGVPRKDKDVLTQTELARLLEQTKHESPDVAVMIWVGFTTGMRFGELSALTWDDVQFPEEGESGVIHVRRSQVYGVVGPTKTNSKRSVPLHPMVASMLRAHRKWLEGRTKSNVVFPASRSNGKGSGYRFSGLLSKPLKRCASSAGIAKHVTAHTMRRTFNNLARQAAGEIVARAMTGHMTQAMTEHYSHVTLAEKSKALEAALGPLGTGVLGLPVGVDVENPNNSAETAAEKTKSPGGPGLLH